MAIQKRGRRSSGRVFILGAGVSATCGIPVAKDILRAAVLSLKRWDKPSQQRIHDLLRYLYPSFNVALENYPNIEDFLNLLEMALTFNSEEFIQSKLWPAAELRRVKTDALKAVTDCIWTLMHDNEMKSVHSFIKHCVQPGDTIVTFNWDLTIEHALEAQAELEFWYEPTTEVLLLKPHGSIDWFKTSALPSGSARRRVQKLDDQLSVYPRFDFGEYQKLRSVPPVIVPPVLAKDFSPPFLRKTWRRVYRAISQAAHLYVIGYSLPPEDRFARLVLGRAIRNNRLAAKRNKTKPLTLTVVNPDEAVQTTFIKLFGESESKYLYYQTSFATLIAAAESDEIDFPQH